MARVLNLVRQKLKNTYQIWYNINRFVEGDTMKMIDLIDYKVIDVVDYKTVTVPLSLRREMELNIHDFDIEFNRQLDDFFADFDFAAVEDPIYFILHTDLGVQDRELIGDLVLTRFMPHILAKEIPADRERRLGVPPGLEKIHLQYATLVDIVNKYEHIKTFNIGIATRAGKNIIDLVS